jgi:hypothetical protein
VQETKNKKDPVLPTNFCSVRVIGVNKINDNKKTGRDSEGYVQ